MKNHEEFIISRILKSLKKEKQHIALSLTENCPLACKHCIVSAKKGSIDKSETPLKIAEWVINGLNDNASRVSAISFTGGESSLAVESFKAIGEAAKMHSIPCGLVTSGFWGRDVQKASDFIKENSFLKQITVSIDEYHARYLDLNFPLNCAVAAIENKINVAIRYTGDMNSDFYINLVKKIEIKNINAELECQPLVIGGRAEGLSSSSRYNSVISQCLSDGPHVSAKGNILPCCSNIVSSDKNQVLGFGDIYTKTFKEVLDLFESQRALQIIRVWGWDHVIENIPEMNSIKKRLSCKGGCEQCAMITLNNELSLIVNAWLDTAEAQCSYSDAIAAIKNIRANIVGEYYV